MCNSADFMLHATKPLPHVGRHECDDAPLGVRKRWGVCFQKNYCLIKFRSSGVFFFPRWLPTCAVLWNDLRWVFSAGRSSNGWLMSWFSCCLISLLFKRNYTPISNCWSVRWFQADRFLSATVPCAWGSSQTIFIMRLACRLSTYSLHCLGWYLSHKEFRTRMSPQSI